MGTHRQPRTRAVLGLVLPLLCAAGPALGRGERSALQVLEDANAALSRVVLDNGAVCLIKEDHSAPVVAVQIWVGTGSIHEEECLGAGLSHYLEHMVFKGTPTRAAGEITQAIDNEGGAINAYTGHDRTVYHAVMPSRAWRTAVDVLVDAVLNASFPEEEWERERDVVLREVAMGKDDPRRVLSKLLFQTAYRVHPYRFPVIGLEDILTAMTRAELISFHRRHYLTDNLIVAVVGDVSAGEAEAYLREHLGAVSRRARAPVTVPEEPPQLAARYVRKTGAYRVSRLQCAFHTVPLSHPDTAALDVLAQVLGQGRSSRLVRDLREERQLVHAIEAWSYTPKHPGLFSVEATFEPEREPEVVDALRAHVASWPDLPFAEGELAKAKRQALVHELRDLQTAQGQASSYASGEFYAGDARFSETYLARVEAVTAEDLRRVAGAYLRPSNRSLVVLAPESTPEAGPAPPPVLGPRETSRVVLRNGVRLLVRPDHRLPFVYVSAAMRGGLLSEAPEQNGIARLSALMLTRGTSARSAEETAETVESLGAVLQPFSGRNSFGLNARCLTQDADVMMGLLADCLVDATLPEEEWAKQRTLQLAAIAQQRERPFYLADRALARMLFPDHPYRWDELGRVETVSRITRDEGSQYLKELVTGSNLVVSVFGDLALDEARRLAEEHLTRVRPGPAPVFDHPRPEPDLPQRAEQREPKEQTILLVGYPGVAVDDPRIDALEIVQEAMSGLSSDLGIEVRDKRGLAYFVGAFQRVGLDPGCFAFYAGTREDALAEVEQLIREQAQRVATQGLRPEELDRARRQIIARHERSLQDNGGLAQTCALHELYGLGFDHVFATQQRMEQVSGDDVRTVAASVLRPGLGAAAVVLPEAGTEAKENQP
jgi:zinc protease